MSVVYGKPSSTSGSEEVSSWNECLRNCYEQKDCVLVYLASPTSICLLFRFGNITSINKLPSSSPQIVAFRTSLSSSTCPLSFTGFSSASKSTQSIYNSTITSSNSKYLITNFQIICPTNSTLLIRPSGPVCVGIRYFPSFSCGFGADASTLCGQSGGMGLTGPVDQTEYDLFLSWTSYANLTKNGVPAAKAIDLRALFWIDGNNNAEAGNYVFEDKTHNGYSGYPKTPTAGKMDKTGYCFYYPFRNDPKIDTYQCTGAASGGACFIGALCRLKPTKQIGKF